MITTIKPVNEFEKEQARMFKAREEERELEKMVNQSLKDMPEQQKKLLKTNFMNKMSFQDIGVKEALAEVELRAFIFERVLYSRKQQYLNLFNEYQAAAASRQYLLI